MNSCIVCKLIECAGGYAIGNLKFYNELMSKYAIDDFTGHIGILLAEGEDPECAVGIDEARRCIDSVNLKYCKGG